MSLTPDGSIDANNGRLRDVGSAVQGLGASLVSPGLGGNLLATSEGYSGLYRMGFV